MAWVVVWTTGTVLGGKIQIGLQASAGTGKTFSIALLYLRLVLERKLEVDQILVVTFTRSATDELRERIRRADHEYYVLNRPTLTDAVYDDLYRELVASYPSSDLFERKRIGEAVGEPVARVVLADVVAGKLVGAARMQEHRAAGRVARVHALPDQRRDHAAWKRASRPR